MQGAETPPVQYKFLPRDVYYDQFFTETSKLRLAGDKKWLPSPIGS
jgi:hypothetical protein